MDKVNTVRLSLNDYNKLVNNSIHINKNKSALDIEFNIFKDAFSTIHAEHERNVGEDMRILESNIKVTISGILKEVEDLREMIDNTPWWKFWK